MSDCKSTQELYDSLLLKIKEGTLTAKDRSAIPQQEMPVGDPKERARQMTEVARGYSKEQTVIEANRCLQCKNAPCVSGCPVNVPIPQFIAHVAKGEFKEAVDVIKTTNLLPAICGRVCPQEKQCQGQCTVGKIFKNPEKAVSIGRLERFVADYERENNLITVPPVAPETGKKVAVIGSGPAGLTVAADVRRAGHDVTVFEAFHKEGGVMVYGIPEFRLPKAIVANEVENLKKMGNIKDLLGMIPGLGSKIKAVEIDEKQLLRQKAIIQSMTPYERKNPEVIKASQRKRIAEGSGTGIQDVNQLLKQLEKSKEMMKMLKNKKGFGI